MVKSDFGCNSSSFRKIVVQSLARDHRLHHLPDLMQVVVVNNFYQGMGIGI